MIGRCFISKKQACRLYAVLLAAAVLLSALGIGGLPGRAQAAKGPSLNKQKVTLQVGGSVRLKVKGTKKKVTWSSNKKAVAAVTAQGKVTGRKPGTAKITARVAGKKLTCTVRVKAGETTPDASSAPGSYTFRSEELLNQHYEKHGKAMGYPDAASYVAGANRVIQSPDALHKLEAEDGDHVYFLESTGEIVFLSADGYIRTYFIPDDGIAYFNRQIAA